MRDTHPTHNPPGEETSRPGLPGTGGGTAGTDATGSANGNSRPASGDSANGAQRVPVPAGGRQAPHTKPLSKSPAPGERRAGPTIEAPVESAPVPGIAGLPPLQALNASSNGSEGGTRRRLSLWAGLLILAVVLVLEFLMISPWTDPVASKPARQIPAIPLTDVNPYGVNTFLHKEVDTWKKEKTLDMAGDMGAVWIKQQFPWAEIEYTQNGYWDTKNNQSAWDKFDNIVDLAQQRGLHIIARIDSTPEWARTDDGMPQAVRDALRGDPKVPPSKAHLIDFGRFVETFVQRYKGRIAAIQVWNEPNLKAEWSTGVNAKDYVALLQTAYLAAKGTDPNMIVLAAPLATNNEKLEYAGNLNELDYLQAMYYAGAKQYFDVMAANAYGTSYPPEDPPSRAKLNFRRVELLRGVMEDNGDANKAVWFNEYGWNASTADCCDAYPWGRVTPEQQADYTVRGIEYARAHWPWAGAFTIWYLRQVGDIAPTRSDYYFGLVNTDFAQGTAYKEVKTEANKPQVATPGDWSALSQPVSVGPRWEVRMNTLVPGGVYAAPSALTVEKSNSLELTFEGTDVTLMLVPAAVTQPLSSTAVVNARYYVTVDGSPTGASNLPLDDAGHAYIDLPPGGQATEVKVVSGLGAEFRTGQHKVTITAVKVQDPQDAQGAGHVAAPLPQETQVNLPGIAAFRVEARRSYVLFTLITLLLMVGIGIELWALRRSSPPAPAVKARTAQGSQSANGR